MGFKYRIERERERAKGQNKREGVMDREGIKEDIVEMEAEAFL